MDLASGQRLCRLVAACTFAVLVLLTANSAVRADIASSGITNASIQVVDVDGSTTLPTGLTLSGAVFVNTNTTSVTPGPPFTATNTPTVTVPSSLTPGGSISLGALLSATMPTSGALGDAFAISELGAAIMYLNLSGISHTVDLKLTFNYTLSADAVTNPLTQSVQSDSRIVVINGSTAGTVLDTGEIVTTAPPTLGGSGTLNFSVVTLPSAPTATELVGLGIGASVDVDSVPEPGPLILCGVGLVCAGACRVIRCRMR